MISYGAEYWISLIFHSSTVIQWVIILNNVGIDREYRIVANLSFLPTNVCEKGAAMK